MYIYLRLYHVMYAGVCVYVCVCVRARVCVCVCKITLRILLYMQVRGKKNE